MWKKEEGILIEFFIFNYSIKVWEALAVLGVLLSVVEIFAPGFILLPIGLAFIAAAVAAIFLTTPLAILISLAISLAFLIWLFQFQLKFTTKRSSAVDTNVEGMKGQQVLVTEKIKGSDFGEAKLYGDRWRVYSISKRNYEVGERALVIKVDGNKLALE